VNWHLVASALVVLMAAALFLPRPGRLRLVTPKPRRQTAPLVAVAGLTMIAAIAIGGPWAKWAAFIVAGAELTATLGWLTHKSVRQKRGLRNERDVIRACSLMAGQLDAGEIPASALLSTAEDVALLAPAAGALGIGGDVATELHKLARRGGCAGLDWVARGWRLCERTGMPLSPVMRHVADTLRQEGDVRDQRRAELATARSTSRLLAGLPVVGIVMGFVVNANPLKFLGGSLAGHICLVAAATLMCAGLIWTDHLAKETP